MPLAEYITKAKGTMVSWIGKEQGFYMFFCTCLHLPKACKAASKDASTLGFRTVLLVLASHPPKMVGPRKLGSRGVVHMHEATQRCWMFDIGNMQLKVGFRIVL